MALIDCRGDIHEILTMTMPERVVESEGVESSPVVEPESSGPPEYETNGAFLTGYEGRSQASGG